MWKYIDLSHTIEDGMITYKGFPAPVICDFLSREASRGRYEEGTEFQIGKIEMIANTGTYIDVPFHRFSEGADLSEVGVERFAGLEGILIDASRSGDPAIDRSWFEPYELRGKAVLVRTDWSKHWRTDQYFENHPFLTEGAARFLRDVGATLVGIDTHNIDDTRGNKRPVHTILLGAGVLIVEHLTNLSRIPSGGFRFYAVPPKVRGFGSFPVRAFAVVAEENV